MGYLLDINILIARADPAHPFYRWTRAWLTGLATETLATCPLTENGFLRIFGHPNYSGGPGPPEAARELLKMIRRLPNHQFLSDSITFDDPAVFPSLANSTPKHLTDLYLLTLTGKHGLKFTTFDRNIPAHLVIDGAAVLEVIPA